MNELVSSIILAVVQGITEWFPVSSSGHLVVLEKLLGFANGGIVFDVALHFGTLMAVFVYFGKDIVDMVEDVLRGRWGSESGKLFWLLVLATLPAGVIGYLFYEIFALSFGSLGVVSLGFGITGLLLMIASLKKGIGKSIDKIDWKIALLIGAAQMIALVPGVSRAGATIVAGILLGLREKDAIKFSFLMFIPAIFGASILTLGNERLPSSLIWATLVSFAVGIGAIYVLSSFILQNRKNLRWFALYVFILAVGVGIWAIAG